MVHLFQMRTVRASVYRFRVGGWRYEYDSVNIVVVVFPTHTHTHIKSSAAACYVLLCASTRTALQPPSDLTCTQTWWCRAVRVRLRCRCGISNWFTTRATSTTRRRRCVRNTFVLVHRRDAAIEPNGCAATWLMSAHSRDIQIRRRAPSSANALRTSKVHDYK